MQTCSLPTFATSTLLVLGIGHFFYAFCKFKTPLLAAISAGFTGQLGSPEFGL
jgi:hypothetical protein